MAALPSKLPSGISPYGLESFSRSPLLGGLTHGLVRSKRHARAQQLPGPGCCRPRQPGSLLQYASQCHCPMLLISQRHRLIPWQPTHRSCQGLAQPSCACKSQSHHCRLTGQQRDAGSCSRQWSQCCQSILRKLAFRRLGRSCRPVLRCHHLRQRRCQPSRSRKFGTVRYGQRSRFQSLLR